MLRRADSADRAEPGEVASQQQLLLLSLLRCADPDRETQVLASQQLQLLSRADLEYVPQGSPASSCAEPCLVAVGATCSV